MNPNMRLQTYTQEDVSDLFQIPVRMLENWRNQGGGPAYVMVGRNVRYRAVALQAYIDAHTKQSTRD